MNNDHPMDTTAPAADASAPLAGAGQAAGDQTADQLKKPAEETGAMDVISGLVEGVCDVGDIVGGVLSIFDV